MPPGVLELTPGVPGVSPGCPGVTPGVARWPLGETSPVESEDPADPAGPSGSRVGFAVNVGSDVSGE